MQEIPYELSLKSQFFSAGTRILEIISHEINQVPNSSSWHLHSTLKFFWPSHFPYIIFTSGVTVWVQIIIPTTEMKTLRLKTRQCNLPEAKLNYKLKRSSPAISPFSPFLCSQPLLPLSNWWTCLALPTPEETPTYQSTCSGLSACLWKPWQTRHSQRAWTSAAGPGLQTPGAGGRWTDWLLLDLQNPHWLNRSVASTLIPCTDSHFHLCQNSQHPNQQKFTRRTKQTL